MKFLFKKGLKSWHISIILIPALLSFSFFSFSDSPKKNPSNSFPVFEKGMYVIVGVFGIESNAFRYVDYIKKFNYSAKISKKQGVDLNYVYIYYTPDDIEAARKKRTEARWIPELHKTWILYVGVTMPSDESDGKFTPLASPMVIDERKDEPVETVPEKVVETKPAKPGMYNFIFNVTNATTLKEVNGFVTIVDAERNKQIQKAATNTLQEIQAPGTKTKKIIVICDIFGYLKQQVELRIDDPLTGTDPGTISVENGVINVKFVLQRNSKGDIITMYNVYFYNDAVIMKPESKYELNCLLDMLKENENYTIKLHGHTNGNSPGKIIKLKPDDDNFFTITSNNDEIFGSAKDLSLDRANTIKRYLVANGISTDRMTVKGWGGKKMIYNKTDPLAKRNVRVEVEIISE